MCEPLSLPLLAWRPPSIGRASLSRTLRHSSYLHGRDARAYITSRGLAPSIDKKEKCCERNEKCRSPEHPHFIREQRRDLLRGKNNKRNSKNRLTNPQNSEDKNRLPSEPS